MTKPPNEFVVCQIVTLKNMGFSYQQICDRLGLHNRFTERSEYQRFLKNKDYLAKKAQEDPEN